MNKKAWLSAEVEYLIENYEKYFIKELEIMEVNNDKKRSK
jgi:hypothetical protein